MLRHLTTWLTRYARRRVIAGLALAWVVAQGGMGLLLMTPPSNTAHLLPPDLRWSYTPETLARILAAWKSVQSHFLLSHLVVDNLYPWLYGALLALLLTAFYRPSRAEPLPWWVWGLPGLAILADIGENLLLSLLLWQYPARWAMLARVAAWCTQAKWTAVGLSIGLLLWGAFRWGWQRLGLARGDSRQPT